MNAEELAKLLDELGRRLEPTGQHVLQLAIRYQVTNAVVGVLLSITLAVSAVIAILWLWRRYEASRIKNELDMWADNPWEFPLFLGGGLGALAIFVGVLAFAANLVILLNPEYAALRDILGNVRR